MKIPWLSKSSPTLLSPLEGYERWANSYAQESNPIKNLSNEYITRHWVDLQDKTVLDAGCGTGYFCQFAEKNGASKITGVDLSPAMIEIAKKNCHKTEFKCLDFSSHSLGENLFDFVICALVLGHITNLDSVIKNISKALKSGGIFLLTDFHPALTLRHEKRTFKTGGGWFEIRHYLHPLEEIILTIKKNGFELDVIEEPEWNGVPVVYFIKAKKSK
jgi:malonyl-CoA O-methyltransferase